MCEQGSGRAVNRPFYEAARGELGCQWTGLSHVCHVSTLSPGLFVLMAARDWRDLFTLDTCQAGEFPLHERLDLWDCNGAAGAVHLTTKASGVAPIYCIEIISPDSGIICYIKVAQEEQARLDSLREETTQVTSTDGKKRNVKTKP